MTDQDNTQVVPAPTPETVPAAGTGEPSDQTTAEPELTDDEKAAKEADKQNRRAQRSYQRRLDELTRQRREAEREAEHWRSLANQGQQQTRSDGEPKESDYKDYAQFLEDRAAWRVRQELAQAESQRSQMREQERLAQMAEAARSRIEAASEKYDDFEDVAFRPDVPISQAMFEAMADSEFIADIAYHLGKNPDQARKIAGMSPFAAAREIGRIEANLTAKTPAQTTTAPAPARVVRTSTTPPGDLANVKDINEWMKRRNAQIAKERGG